mgnify:CR=1 FL=1
MINKVFKDGFITLGFLILFFVFTHTTFAATTSAIDALLSAWKNSVSDDQDI